MNRLAVYIYLTRCAYGHAGFGRLFTGKICSKRVNEPEFRTNSAAAVTEDRISRICSGSKRALVR